MMALVLLTLVMGSYGMSLPQRVTRGRSEASSPAKAAISAGDVVAFMRDGHLFKRQLIERDRLDPLLPLAKEFVDANLLTSLRHKVEVTLGRADAATLSLAQCQALLAEVDPSFFPFLQIFNLWKTLPAARDIACSALLGSAAAALLGVNSVRLYQDSLFVKRPGDGPTLWHTGKRMSFISSS